MYPIIYLYPNKLDFDSYKFLQPILVVRDIIGKQKFEFHELQYY